MKKYILPLAGIASSIVLVMWSFIVPQEAKTAPVTAITFSITSAAVPSAANLEIQTMSKRLAQKSGVWVQGFAPDGATLNYLVTKNTTVDVSSYGAIRIKPRVDMKMKVGSESTYYTLSADTDNTYVIHE